MRGEMDHETGEIRAYVFKTVVETPEQVEDPDNQLTLEQARELAPEVEVGGELRFYKDTTPLGRIAAQMAKQVIFQKVREAERDTVFHEYGHRAGEILTATVKRLEPMDVIFDLGKAEARMPKREQSRLEQFAVGERVRVVLLRVDRAAKGPQVIVSRAAPALVQILFQSEVPEIYDGTVTIRAIAREAGERTKIAVMSRDKDVDPVGACVGMKGMRVQSIIRELRGEKIDIIEFSEEITTFAEKALQPAKVSRVSITDLAEKQLEVIVDDTQLSLAIGKKGQNVRLAAKLLGWKIDIKSEEEKRQEVEQQMQAMAGGPTTPIEQVTELGEASHGKAHRRRHHHRRGTRRHDRRRARRRSPASAKRPSRRSPSPSATTSASTKKAKSVPSPWPQSKPQPTPRETSSLEPKLPKRSSPSKHAACR